MRAALDDLESAEGLLRGALAIDVDAHPDLDITTVEATLEALADQIRGRVQSGDPRALIAHAHSVLFDDEQFRGAEKSDYHEPHNSYLSAVLERRRGLPIVLVLIYVQVLGRLGIEAVGLNAPGHFLAGVRTPWSVPSGLTIVDPFAGGRVLAVEEACQAIDQLVGAALSPGQVTQVATHRSWLRRMLRNLCVSHEQRGRKRELAAVTELMALLD